MIRWLSHTTLRTARQLAIAVAGVTVLLVGVAMLVLPGPGIVVIGGGLALLSLEFAFAQRWLAQLRKKAESAADQAGIPERYRLMLVIGSFVLALAMMILPGFFTVVRGPDGWAVLWNHRFTFSHSWTTVERLQKAAANGDEDAALLLHSFAARHARTAEKEPTP